MNMKKAVLLLWGSLACFMLLGAPKNYKADYSEKYPVLDGKIAGDPAWESVKWEEGFLLHRKNAAPLYPTRFKALYTNDALYVAVECYEEDITKLKKVYNFNEFWIYDTVELFLMPGKDEVMQFIANYESMTQESIPGNVQKEPLSVPAGRLPAQREIKTGAWNIASPSTSSVKSRPPPI